MNSSILTSTKKNLGISEDYTAFDADILMYINSVLSTLCQIGIGPEEGFEISDDTATWGDFLGTDKRLNSVKTYVTLRVRLLFDPPQTSFLIASLQKQLEEIEWRLNVVRETTDWVDPEPVVISEDDELHILDGGTP
jgi:hypothetical protein